MCSVFVTFNIEISNFLSSKAIIHLVKIPYLQCIIQNPVSENASFEQKFRKCIFSFCTIFPQKWCNTFQTNVTNI